MMSRVKGDLEVYAAEGQVYASCDEITEMVETFSRLPPSSSLSFPYNRVPSQLETYSAHCCSWVAQYNGQRVCER